MTSLVEYEKNAKKHPTEQLELIAKSISRFGWQQPIKAGKGGVILAGHGRWKAYNQFKDIYPMVIVTDYFFEYDLLNIPCEEQKNRTVADLSVKCFEYYKIN